MTSKLAIHGGPKTRKVKISSRYSFGKNENKEIKKMIAYYRSRGEDQSMQVCGKKILFRIF